MITPLHHSFCYSGGPHRSSTLRISVQIASNKSVPSHCLSYDLHHFIIQVVQPLISPKQPLRFFLYSKHKRNRWLQCVILKILERFADKPMEIDTILVAL